MSQETNHNFERRAQSIIASVILALVLWVGYTMVGLRDSAVKQDFQYEKLTRDTAELKAEIAAIKIQVVAAALASASATAAAAVAAAAAAAGDDRRRK